ncbi:putative toxin-antitoxin system toxin component, PIN family (plasmid) [Tsukamurella tyrosinosolvens]|uniref:Putative toxin-antitoxin system toxin component, PIN family n=1 Tax=Tsukamurella tyrosinosolvens TaxID=57704 RepID=A0A1H5AZ74_TSUTY|nr:putative toxin-antitoxin system toxin component, PIN family [Tsukamurella tyrosinosolvens]SED47779.1 putative toxin-antitoxin system toxin component, PIN family [Tsukamurella tyrosinosolvens]VEH88862.1 putative toxin-antitoxin system toxin component, PIN family [Tsukamurella tyrosinosolvens]
MLDTNTYISAAISPSGTCAQLVELARQGRVRLVVSPHLLDELETRLAREKFRRWLTLDDVRDFVDALTLLADMVDDRPENETPHVCTDPDDNFLVALFQDAQAAILVSGDKAVLAIEYPGLDVRKPAEALAALTFTHEWGEGYLEGSEERSFAQIEDEGNRGIFAAYSSFVTVLEQPNAHELLPYVVVPETLKAFRRDLAWLRENVLNRGITTRPDYASPDIAHLKLPPDPGVNLRATDEIRLPDDTIYATMQRCPDLDDLPGAEMGQWRVFGIGAPVPPQKIRPRPRRNTR